MNSVRVQPRRSDLLKAIGVRETIPLDLEGEWTNVNVYNFWTGIEHTFDVKIQKSSSKMIPAEIGGSYRNRRQLTHRVFLRCKTCNEWIFAGKFNQHLTRADH